MRAYIDDKGVITPMRGKIKPILYNGMIDGKQLWQNISSTEKETLEAMLEHPRILFLHPKASRYSDIFHDLDAGDYNTLSECFRIRCDTDSFDGYRWQDYVMVVITFLIQTNNTAVIVKGIDEQTYTQAYRKYAITNILKNI